MFKYGYPFYDLVDLVNKDDCYERGFDDAVYTIAASLAIAKVIRTAELARTFPHAWQFDYFQKD